MSREHLPYMSDTPRTDAYVEFWLKDRLALWPDFARNLEREINQLKNEYVSKIRIDQGVDAEDGRDRHAVQRSESTDREAVVRNPRGDQERHSQGASNIHAS